MVKEAYQSEVLNNLKNVKTSDDFLKDECEKQEKACKEDEIKKKLLDSYKKDYGTIVSNPELQYFVKQRRTIDKWGRMILMKPNRNYFKSQTKGLYNYVAFDYLNQVMLVSMRENKEFNDIVILKIKIDLNH